MGVRASFAAGKQRFESGGNYLGLDFKDAQMRAARYE
jgi:hypothetical protein